MLVIIIIIIIALQCFLYFSCVAGEIKQRCYFSHHVVHYVFPLLLKEAILALLSANFMFIIIIIIIIIVLLLLLLSMLLM